MGRTRLAASVIGVIGGLVGIFHGYNETLQGSVATGGVFINAIGPPCVQGPDVCFPAMTLIPNFWITGIAAILVALALIVVSAMVRSKRGSYLLVVVSLVLLLVGGGFLPPLLGIVSGAIAFMIKPAGTTALASVQTPPAPTPTS